MEYFKNSLMTSCILLLAACSSTDEELIQFNDEETCRIATLHIDGGIQHFDSQTRAMTSEWEDGAKLYIKYKTANDKVDGVATYNQNSDEWEANYYGSLTRGDTTSCEVYYFENSVDDTETFVTLNEYSAVYSDTKASYYYNNGIVTLKATLKPLTGRIRFNGYKWGDFSVNGLMWYSGYDIKNNTLVKQKGKLDIELYGGSEYIYATFATTRQLTADIGDKDYFFIKMCDASVLSKGKSGYIAIPDIDNHNGWTKVAFSDIDTDFLGFCPDSRHPHMIDMGTDVKWACCNVGASTPTSSGSYFAWGETIPKTTFEWSNYKWCEGTEFSMKKYCVYSKYGEVDDKEQLELEDDAAHIRWGGAWHIPTDQDLRDLWDDCVWSWMTINKTKGYKVTASNGNSIFLPAAGYYDGGWDEYFENYGLYWSSSLEHWYNNYARYLSFSDEDISLYSQARCDGLSIRPVSQ